MCRRQPAPRRRGTRHRVRRSRRRKQPRSRRRRRWRPQSRRRLTNGSSHACSPAGARIRSGSVTSAAASPTPTRPRVGSTLSVSSPPRCAAAPLVPRSPMVLSTHDPTHALPHRRTARLRAPAPEHALAHARWLRRVSRSGVAPPDDRGCAPAPPAACVGGGDGEGRVHARVGPADAATHRLPRPPHSVMRAGARTPQLLPLCPPQGQEGSWRAHT